MSQPSSVVFEDARAATPCPGIGDVVGGKYRLSRLLGEGGMGIVYEAEHLRLLQRVAIKWLRPDVLALPDALERFHREARAICRMRGPHVAHVMDVDADAAGRPYMVMELLRGRDLEAELQARGALPIAEAVDWVLQACAAIAEAHAEGIVHRDLKPSNLFLAEEAGARVLKVLDFGISKVARDEPSVTVTAMTLGTPLYMSPEQVRSARDVDGRTDIWSLGVILYELLTGSPPFLGTTTAAIAAIVADATPRAREARADIPEGLQLAIMTALAKSPDNRFPTAEAFAAALTPFASAQGIEGPFSLRPSLEAFAIASSTMARVPSGPRASDASELLRLPTSRTGRPPPRPHRPWTATWTFVGTVAIGVAAVTGAALGARRSTAPAHESLAPAPAAVPAEPSPNEVLVEAAPERSLLVPRGAEDGTSPATGGSADVLPARRPSPERGRSLEEPPFAITPAPSAAGATATRPRSGGSPAPDTPTTPRLAPATPPPARGHNAPSHAPIDRPLYL
jgi:serine/threonine-protein kinase